MEHLYNGVFKNRRVLITGHTGFKGAWLCLLLHKLGARVSGYALPPPTEPSLFKLANLTEVVQSYEGDIRNYAYLCKVLEEVKPEIIIHMAAQPLVRDSYKNPVETYAINVMGTVHLLEAVRQVAGIKAVLNVTTDKCYENKEWFWGYRENEPMGGYDPYSNSKACSELVTGAYRSSFFNPNDYDKHGVAIASARAGNVIGGGDWASDRLVPDFIRAITNNKKVHVRNPTATRPWQHVLEPLSGYLALAARLFDSGPQFAEGWNFGPNDDDAKNVGWIIDKICSLWGENAAYEIDNSVHPHEANYLKLDCSKARALLGWQPRWNIENALESIVNWTKEYKNNKNVREITVNQIEDYFLN